MTYPTGLHPASAVVDDFNGDGKADLAVLNRSNDGAPLSDYSISILLGNGDGTFQANVDYPTGLQPGTVVTVDFNGDGKVDIAWPNSGDSNVGIRLGNGDGTFQAAATYATGSYLSDLAVTDFDGDGILDFGVADSTGFGLLKGNGDGTLQSEVNGFPGVSLLSIAVDDFNGDGRSDVAAVEPLALSVLLATAPPATTLTLQSSGTPSTYGQPVTLTASLTPPISGGKVEFLDGTTVLGIGVTNGAGTAQLTTIALQTGTHSLRARYQGLPGGFQPSSSNSITQVVNPISGLRFTSPISTPSVQGTPWLASIARTPRRKGPEFRRWLTQPLR